jgi:hypothetical protein
VSLRDSCQGASSKDLGGFYAKDLAGHCGGVSEKTLWLSLLRVSEETIRDFVKLLCAAMCRSMPGVSPTLLAGLLRSFLGDPPCCPLLSLSGGLLSGLLPFLQQLKSFLALLDDFSRPR